MKLNLPPGYQPVSFEGSRGEELPTGRGKSLYRVFTLTEPLSLRGAAETGFTFAVFPSEGVEGLAEFDNLQINLSNLREGDCALTPGGTASWRTALVSVEGMRGIAFDIPGSFFEGIVSTAAAERAACSFHADDLHLISFSLSSVGREEWLTEVRAAASASGVNRLPAADD